MSGRRNNNVQDSPFEWSYPVNVDRIGDAPLTLTIKAPKEACRNLARRFRVLFIENLTADITLSRDEGKLTVHLTGAFDADITQSCVVTLVPVKEHVHEPFEAWFADPEQVVVLARIRHDRALKQSGGERPLLEEHEDPEPIVDGVIDLGEAVAQFLSLAVNPYPHAEGVDESSALAETPKPVPEIRRNPFAALKDWKDKNK